MDKMAMDFEKILIEAVKALRKRLQQCESVSSFALHISANGRVHDGDVSISFTLTDGSYRENQPMGARLGPVVEEFVRRHAWNERNAPLCISYDGEVRQEEEIAF